MKSFANTKLKAAWGGLLVLVVVVLEMWESLRKGSSGSDSSQFKPRNSEKKGPRKLINGVNTTA
jgi:hypothetical protein